MITIIIIIMISLDYTGDGPKARADHARQAVS
jgi:hypothetical protein